MPGWPRPRPWSLVRAVIWRLSLSNSIGNRTAGDGVGCVDCTCSLAAVYHYHHRQRAIAIAPPFTPSRSQFVSAPCNGVWYVFGPLVRLMCWNREFRVCNCAIIDRDFSLAGNIAGMMKPHTLRSRPLVKSCHRPDGGRWLHCIAVRVSRQYVIIDFGLSTLPPHRHRDFARLSQVVRKR